MFQFGAVAAATPDFIPETDAREWVESALGTLTGVLGPAAQTPHLLTDLGGLGLGRAAAPSDLDSLFDMICGVQEVIGQSELELTVLEIEGGGGPRVPPAYSDLGDPSGKLLHTLHGNDEYLVMFTPAVFKVQELLMASVARELGRLALDQAGLRPNFDDPASLREWDGQAEIAAIMLGMGVWVVNGAYVYESGCCGGGCGIDLRSIRAGLSLPEAAYALALDSQRKGLRRRQVVKHLSLTQKTATKKCWGHIGTSTPAALAAAPTISGELA